MLPNPARAASTWAPTSTENTTSWPLVPAAATSTTAYCLARLGTRHAPARPVLASSSRGQSAAPKWARCRGGYAGAPAGGGGRELRPRGGHPHQRHPHGWPANDHLNP